MANNINNCHSNNSICDEEGYFSIYNNIYRTANFRVTLFTCFICNEKISFAKLFKILDSNK